MIVKIYNSGRIFIKQMTSPCRLFKGDYIKIDEKVYEIYSCVMVFSTYDNELTHQKICIKDVS